jgi:hypothetical protein
MWTTQVNIPALLHRFQMNWALSTELISFNEFDQSQYIRAVKKHRVDIRSLFNLNLNEVSRYFFTFRNRWRL